MSDIHKYAAKGFDVATDAYERGRPEYPQDAVDFMIKELGLNQNTKVGDLGAGTGKLTKMLLKSESHIIAIEPVEGMRNKFSSLLSSVEILNGTAESIPLPDAYLDAVVVGQAFHWFNGEKALKEIHRVLKPGGKIGLIWNARDEKTSWVAELTCIIDPYERGAPRYKSNEWKKAFASTSLFTKLQYSEFNYIQSGSIDTIVDRVGSISFIASLDEVEKKQVLLLVKKLAEKQVNASHQVDLPYRTDVFICTKLN